MTTPKKIRVLIVDDSALVRNILSRGLGADPEIEVVATAPDPYVARDILVRERPDVMTLDIEMPRMDGVTFLRKVMGVLPTPTVVVSSLSTRGSAMALAALEAGALDVVAKPVVGINEGLTAMLGELAERVKVAARSQVVKRVSVHPVEHEEPRAGALAHTTDRIIGVGASTGGVAALSRILPAFPAWAPGIVIVQHMPAGFTADFAKRLDAVCAVRVAEAKDGDRILAGHVLVAPGGSRHLEVRRHGGEYRIALIEGEAVSGHTPSVDVFFRSLAHSAGANAAGCILTGMGRDGAEGLLALRLCGGRTFGQDRESSAVWGMPAAAAEVGAVECTLPLVEMPAALVHAFSKQAPRTSRAPTGRTHAKH